MLRRMLVVCVALFVFVPLSAFAQAATEALVTPEVILNPEVKLVDQEGAGKLYQVGEHVVCVMEGTPKEMGFQHGRLLAKSVRHIVKDGYMPKALYAKGYTREYVNQQSERMEKHFPPEYVEEMRGVVEGLKAAGVSDVTYEEIRTGVTQAEIAHHDPNAPPECTNFAVWGRWTTDGRLLHGRNLDWNVKDGAQESAVIMVWRPKAGAPFMMVGWAASIGSVSGMSSRGITIGEMTSSTQNETFDGLPLFLIMRRVIEKATNLNEAVAIMQKGPRTTGWNFVIGDGMKLDARALEVDAVDCEVYGPADPKEGQDTGHRSMPDAVRRTNHPCGMNMCKKLVARYGAQYGIQPDDVKSAIPLLQLQNTWQRYDWLGAQIEARPGKIDVAEALQMLANGPVRNDVTLHSWVFDPKNRTAYVAVAGSNPPVTSTSRAYTKIDLSEWFK